ncbi:hypothetical protein N7453_010130 [Penicillium expansum]|nr:hypothetical protein N7453_010130 [Penicillium expansum]
MPDEEYSKIMGELKTLIEKNGLPYPTGVTVMRENLASPSQWNLVQYKVITGDVYLEVTADVNRQRIGHIPRFMKPHQGLNQPNDVEAQDTPGYQWNQVRGMWVFDTSESEDINIGTVVLFAVGMAQISSVITDVSPSDNGTQAQYVPQKGPSDGLSDRLSDGPEVCKDIPMALYKIHFPQGSAISPLLAKVTIQPEH